MKGLFFGLLAAMTLAATDVAAATAGAFQFVAGEVRLTLANGEQRPARKGTPVSVGDTVTTERDAVAQIKMGDGGILVVQPSSRLTVAEYRYTGLEDGSEKVVYRLEEGGFRAITGAIGHTHKENYLIETPIAHLGVRGTDHESYYFPSAGLINGAPVAAGVYNKVNVGAAYIRTRGGEVLIRPNQAGFVASVSDTPRLLAEIPSFFNRAVPPRPAQVGPEPSRVAAVAVVQTVSTTDGVNLSNPSASAGGAPAQDSGSVAGYISGNFGGSAVNPTLATNGATLAQTGSGDFGVNWGTWQGGSPTVNGNATRGGVHVASSTQLTTAAQLSALAPALVTASYNYAGGPPPTNQAGTAGAITKLAVGVNFATQSITSYGLEANAGGARWSANGSGSVAQFTSGSGITLGGNCISGCAGGGSPAAKGSASGAFVGPAAERMITSFGLKAANDAISGAALLSR